MKLKGSDMDGVTGVILAGGVSRRMGYRNKALLELGSSTIIERIVDTLSRVTGRILLITNTREEFEHLKLPIFGDIIPGSGSLGGIYTGLKVSNTHHNLIVACDMPFIQPCLLEFLIDRKADHDVVIPVTPDGHQPTCAIYSKNCIKPIEDQIKTGNLKITNFFPSVKVRKIDVAAALPGYGANMFFNINTNEDYLKSLDIEKLYRDQNP